MVLKTQSSFGSMASKAQLPQVIDQRSTIISRKNSELPLFFDRCFDKNRIKTFIGWLLAHFGENATVYVVEKLKNLGFHFATEAGISLSIDDLQVPSNKNWFLSQAEKDIKRNQNNFQCGNLTPVEQSQQLLDRWHRTSEILRESVIQSFRLTNTLNPVYMMAFSGARGNISQVRQLVGMRGLMADPQGQIISFPIRSNFREGLTLTEYVISCYGARKGVVDTALRTADSGYLTRRLVDVSQHVVVWTFDCKTDAGIHLTEMKEGKKVILSLKKRILGRVLAQEIPTIAFRNQQISAQLAQQIVSLKEHVLVRSPLSCSVPNSVCQLCYGWSLSRGRIVSLGEAVGVIAAQSIGEPGTQLTMRTFHTGGVFSGDVIDDIRAPHDGLIRFLQPLLGQLIRTSHGKIAYLTRANGSFAIENNLTERKPLPGAVLNSQESMVTESQSISDPMRGTPIVASPPMKSGSISVVPNKHFASQNTNLTVINLEPGTALFVRQGEKVMAKQLLAEYSSISAQTKERVEAQHQVYSDQKGEIFFDDVVLGKKLKKEDGSGAQIDLGKSETQKKQINLGKEREKGSVLNLQNQFKQSDSEFSILPSVEQNIQKGDQQSGRKVDIVTSLKLNTLWILSGTFFEPPISSTLYTKIGDLVDKTTLLTLIKNELNLQTSHLDGEYILSAQLKKNKITKRREKSLIFFRKNLVSSKLPKISQRSDLEDDMEKRESLFLNKFSLNLVITNIKYKKSGYFFTSYKKEKPYNFYSLFQHFVSQNVKAGSANLSNNLINSKFLQSKNQVSFNKTKNYKENNKVSNWNFIFDKVETNFSSFPNSYIATKQESFPRKEIKNMFVLGEPKQIRIFSLKPNKSFSLFQKKTEILRLFATDRVIKTEFVLGKSKEQAALFLNFFSGNSLVAEPQLSLPKRILALGPMPKSFYDTQDSRIFMLKYSKESAKAKDLWWRIHNSPSERWFRTKIDLETLNEKRKVLRKNKSFLDAKMHFGNEKMVFAEQKFRENQKNVNHFFTTTSLNQPFSNCREFKNEFVLQWFSPLFKTKTGGLIYTNNHYCNKRSTETHIFFIAEENYGKKDLGKMNFGRRKKSFNIVSFKELIAPSICLTNVFLNGKLKPSSSFNNFPTSFSEDLAHILFINKKPSNFDTKVNFGKERNVFSGKIDFDKKQPGKNIIRDHKRVYVNSLLNEIFFLQNNNLDKELFFLRKKENFSINSVCFHSTKTETFNTTINLLKKGFFSFKKKWVETDIPLGYQKNLQGNQIPFYSTENGILKNNPAPSFFTNQYSNYWARKKSKKLSGSFLKNFFPLTFKNPLPHIKVKKRDFYRKKGFFTDSFYLNKNELFGQNDILITNFNRKSSNEKLYQKRFWLANQQKRASKKGFFSESKEIILKSALNFKPVETKFYERKPSFLYSKDKIRFSLPFLLTKLHLNPAKNKVLKFNPFPSKGNYASSAFLFRINLRAIFSSDLQKENLLFYNPYPYSQPIFAEFLQNKSTANFSHLTKKLKIDLDLQNKHLVLQSKTLFPKRSPRALQTQNSSDLTEIKIDLQGKSKADVFALYSTQENVQKEKQEKNLKNLKVVEDYQFPQNFISSNNSQDQGSSGALFLRNEGIEDVLDQRHQDKKFNKFSSFLQKQIQKVSTKKQKKIGENLQKSNLQIRPGWLYLPKDQFQAAKAHQSFIAPFQQNIDEILFDQFPVYIESILRENFEEQLADKYLQPSSNVVNFYKTKTLVEKSQLQKFINQISTVSTKPKQSIQGLKISRERSKKFLLSLRETFWRGSTFSSFVENDFTTSYHNKKNVFKLDAKINFGKEKDNLYQTNLPTNFLNHTKISSTSSFLSFLLRNKKDKKKDKFPFLRPVSINPIKIVFQVVTNKSCRFNSIQSFALSCVNDINFDFSQDFFLQSHIINKNLNQNDICIEKKINPRFFLYLPQISRIYFVKNKPFSDFILAPRQLNFDQVKIKSHIFSDKKPVSYANENDVFKPFLKENQSGKGTIVTDQTFVREVSGEISESNTSDTFDQIKSKEQNWAEGLTLSEKNKNLICRGRQILIFINKTSKMFSFDEAETKASAKLSFHEVKTKELNKSKNLSKTLQNQTFLIQNFSTKVDTNYFSFVVSIPDSLKNKKKLDTIVLGTQLPQAILPSEDCGVATMTNILEHPAEQNVEQVKNSFFDEISSFQKKKPSFFQFLSEKSKLWLLIRKVDEYPLLDTSILQQKTKLYKGNQTFFEKELIYSSTPLSLYMSNRIIFSSKFNKQKKKETYLSFYHSPKVSLKIKEKTFYLLNTFSKLEKQHFVNLSMVLKAQLPQTTSLTKNTFFDKVKFGVGVFNETKNSETKNNEDKLKLPLNLFSCQKIFWQIFDLHRQNVQKNKFFEGKQPLFVKKTFDTERKDLLKDNVSFQRNQLYYKAAVQKKTWFFQKENLENALFPQEKEQTTIRSFKQSYLLHFLFNFHTSKQSPLQRIEIKTTFEKIEGSTQTSSCAHYLNLQRTHTNAKNEFFLNHRNVKIDGAVDTIFSQSEKHGLNLQNRKTEYLQKNKGQSKFSAFSWLTISETYFVEQNLIFYSKNVFEEKLKEKLRILLEKNLSYNFSHKIKENLADAKMDFRKQTSFFTKQSFLQNQDEIKLKSLQEKSKFWKYSFTPFARDLSFTLSFTAKLNQSWFFSLANNVKNKIGALPSEEAKALGDLESSTFQSKKLVREAFISTNKTQLNEKKTKQEYLKNKKSISKRSSSYPLKEKSSHTTLLLDQTITAYDKTPLAITAIMSREEGEIENLKNNSASLILKNSDIEILLTKKEKPLVVVGQLIRYGEQIANGIAAPKSGQIIQVDSNRVTLRKAQPILFPRGGSVDVNHGDYVKEGSPLLSLSYQRLVTGDIVQGIPKIEQLFEARETEGGQPLLSSLHSELEAIFLSYSTQLGLKLAVRESFKEIQQIIVDRVQQVYIAQGVLIADKHFEVVIRQMTSKVRILDGGRPGFLYGELVDLRRVELLNAGVPFANEQALYEPIILGISKACLEAEGFLSPASFQETTRVLSLAAIERKTDFLRGIKERVILGDVIQAGTGFTLYDRPVRKIKQEECIDLSLSVLHNAHSTLSTNQYYKQL